MPTLTPLWVPLVSAAVGATGALATTLVAHSTTRRRDDVRWERERAERREQWHREDAARWLADRRSAYTALLTALQEHWAALAATRGRMPDDAERATIRDLAAAAERARQAVILIAPAEVGGPADALTDLIGRSGERGAGRRTDTPGETAVADGFTALRVAMRADLKVGTAGPGRSTP